MISAAPNLKSIVDDAGAVIFDSRRNQITTLDAMGGYIWRLIDAGKEVEEIARELASQTGEDIQRVQRDVQEFVDDLLTKSLISRKDAPNKREEGR